MSVQSFCGKDEGFCWWRQRILWQRQRIFGEDEGFFTFSSSLPHCLQCLHCILMREAPTLSMCRHTNEGIPFTEHVQMLHWACADIVRSRNPLTDMTDNTEDANTDSVYTLNFQYDNSMELSFLISVLLFYWSGLVLGKLRWREQNHTMFLESTTMFWISVHSNTSKFVCFCYP